MSDPVNSSSSPQTQPRASGGSRMFAFWSGALVFGALTVAVMMLYGNIAQRKAEANNTVLRIVDVNEQTVDPAEWGKNFPRQYDGYIRTSDNAHAFFKWSEGRPPEDAAA